MNAAATWRVNVTRREWAVRVAMFIWLGFWLWFSLAESLGDEPGAWMHLVVPIAPMLIFAAITWFRPVIGGTLLLIGGAAAGIYFANSGALLLLAGPALVMGVLFILMGRTRAPIAT